MYETKDIGFEKAVENIERTIHESEAIIRSNESLVGVGVWNIGNELKNIRDSKSYKEKGFDSFERYIEEELRYKKTNTYRLISVAESYSVPAMGRMGNIGITKLLSLAQLAEDEEREDFIENNPVEDMTTRELEKAVKEKKQLESENRQMKHQQDILLEENKNLREVEPTVIEKAPEDYEQLKQENQELKNAPPVIKEVISDELKEKLLDLEEDKKELEQLRQAGMSLDEYKKQARDIDKKKRDMEEEMASLATTMRKLQEHYDEKTDNSAKQSYVINKLTMAISPLKKSKGELEQLFEDIEEMSEAGKSSILSEISFLEKMVDTLRLMATKIKTEVIFYE